jgi:bifunctional non-homologous end joining protein LigD
MSAKGKKRAPKHRVSRKRGTTAGGAPHRSAADAATKDAASEAKALGDYRGKRDFARTSEPRGGPHGRKRRRALQFVVQKHQAGHLHFDLRLELDGAMKSWAVPKGPSLDPAVRRLAVQVEDHPIEYNAFEGVIPAGEYGGGTVMIWDRGTFAPEDGGGEAAVRAGYARGELKIVLRGRRLRGGWALVRMRRKDRGRAQWLLIKHRDQFARENGELASDEDRSVASGRSMEEISAG